MSLLNDAAAFPQAPGLADTYLQRTLREQQVLLDSAGAGIVFIRQRQVVRCNHRYAEIFGYGSHTDLAGIEHQGPPAWRLPARPGARSRPHAAHGPV